MGFLSFFDKHTYSMIETNRIEFKRELNFDVDIEKEIIAFLNYHEGGTLYIGINKSGEYIGVTDADSDMLKIKDRIKTTFSRRPWGYLMSYHRLLKEKK